MLEVDADGEVSINLELPQCKVEELLKQLQDGQTELKDSYPLAHIAKVEAVAPQTGRREDSLLPQPKLDFDPVSCLARLRQIQERYAVVVEQRERAERAKLLMDRMPIAGEPSPMPPSAPPDSVGATFGPGAPAIVPPPFPPPQGLPFAYAGLPGVMEPKAKPPPEPEVSFLDENGNVIRMKKPDVASGEQLVEDEKILQDDSFSRQLPKPDVLFAKDGMDMSLFQLRTHGEKMAQNVREMCRKLDEAREMAELRQLRTEPEVLDQFLSQQRVIHEQQRKIDEGHMDIKLEEERQFWVEREQRQQRQRKMYGDRFVGAPEGNVQEAYDCTPPQLRLGGRSREPDVDVDDAKSLTEADSRRRHNAMQYVTEPDSLYGKDVAASFYIEEDMPSQAYHKNLLQEALYKGWPAAPTFDPRAPEAEEEPEGEAATDGPARRKRRQPRGQGLNVGRRDSSPKVVEGRAENAPASEQLFMSGWREQNSGGQDSEREHVLGRLRQPPSTNASAPSNSSRGSISEMVPNKGKPLKPAEGALSGMLSRAFGYTDSRMSPIVEGESEKSRPDSTIESSTGVGNTSEAQIPICAFSGFREVASPMGADSRNTPQMCRRPPPRGRTPPRQTENDRRMPQNGHRQEPPFAAFAGDDDDKGRTRKRAVRRHGRAATIHLGGGDDDDESGREGGARPAGIDSDSEAASDEDTGFFSGLADYVGLGEDTSINPFSQQTPWEAEQAKFGASTDHTARYMAGACLEKAPPLVPPDLQDIEEKGYEGVVSSCAEVLALRRGGKLGERLSAQAVLNYLVAVSKNDVQIKRHDEASKHVSILVDILNFYPVAVDIHLWALEGLVKVYQAEDHESQESLSGPIFDAVSTLMTTYAEDPSLYEKAEDMPRRVLSALGLVLTPATTPRLKTEHVDYTLSVIRATGVGPSLMEHGLQVLLVARIAHRIREQAMVARAALRSFRAEPRLVTRAFLTLGAAFEIAVEAAQPDEEPSEGDEARPTDEDLALEGAALSRMNKGGAEPSGVKKRIWEQRLMDQAGLAHKALVEAAPPLAGAAHVQGPTAESKKHMIPVGLRDIITGMDLYAQDRKVQGAAAVAIAAAVMLPGVSPRAMKAEGVVRALILAQQHFSTSRSIALHLCQVMVQFARKENAMLSIDIACTALNAGMAFARDAEVAVAAIQVVHAFALRLHELCPDRSSRLSQMATDLVRIGEGRHGNPHALGMLLVIFAAAASDGRGTTPGGVAGEQWRVALANAAAVVVPLRVLYEHVDNIDLVLAAAIALRVLTYGNKVSAAHAARLRGIEALLGTIQKHHHRADMARELLAALGNMGVDQGARDVFTAKLPDGAEAIYNAMEKCGGVEPDVLAQGCRALGALTAGPKQETARFAIDLNRIDKAVAKTSSGIASRQGATEDANEGYLEIFTGTAEATQQRRKKLSSLCGQLIDCMVASGPQFGRLVGKDGVLLAEIQPRRHAAKVRSKTPPR